MVTCQSANQLKTPAKVSWAFKMVSQFGSLGYTMMGKTADLTVVQKTIIDTLHKEGKPQTFITKKLAVHRVLYPSMLTESWVEGKSVEEKDVQPPREPQPYEDCQAKSIQEFGWTSQGMDWGWGQGIKSTTHRHVKEFGYSCRIPLVKPLLNHRQRQRRLTWAKEKKNWTVASGPKSSFQMRASFVFHLETKVLESGGRVEKLIAQVAWSPVLSFHSLWWFGVAMLSAGVGPLCFWKPTSLHPFTKKFWSTLCFLLLTSFLKMLISFSSRIGTCPHCQKHQKLVKWPWCWCAWLASKLAWPEPHRESMGYCQEENEKWDQKMHMSWRPLSKKPGLPYHLSSATNWSPPCHAELRQ